MLASPLSYNDAIPINKRLLIFILLLQLVIFLVMLLSPIKISLGMILGISALIFIFFFPSPLVACFILSLFIAIILPKPTGSRFIFKAEEIFPFLAFLFLLVSFLQNDYNKDGIGNVGYWLIGFLTVVFIAAIIGLLKGRYIPLIWDELMVFMYWVIFFVVIKSKFTEKNIKYILGTILVSAFIVSLYYIFEFKIMGDKDRFRTDQQHIFNFTIPLLFAILLYDTKKLRKILAVLMMIPMIVAVYITLTRALWVLVPLAIFLQYVYYIKDTARGKKFMVYLLPIFIIAVLASVGIIFLQAIPGVQDMLGGRFATFGLLEYDLSLLARAELAQYVFRRVSEAPLFGAGLGDFLRYQYFSTLGRYNVYWLDHTYLQVLWKTGIIGSILFFGFLVVFFKRAWFVLKNSTTPFDKIISSSIFFSILALAISGMQCGILVGYRFNFVWAILMGIIVLKAQELKKHPIRLEPTA
jgi:hypothetical protein